MFHPGKIKTYRPIVSDVSDDELLETVKELEKSRNVIAPTPPAWPYDAIRRLQNKQGAGDRVPLRNL